MIAHEVGHWAIAEIGKRQSESAADYIAAAMMMPLMHALDDVGASANALLVRHPFCSLRLIRLRKASLSVAFSASSARAVSERAA